MNKSKKNNREDKAEEVQVPLRVPLELKRIIVIKAAEATIKKGEKVTENAWINEAIIEKSKRD